MLTAEENELLTRVGPGTPMGELLRRYWHPIAVARELTDLQPTKFVRTLGEDLVLFRPDLSGRPDASGRARSERVGLIADHCAHRGASLLYGRVEERGIACAYHGWLYDTQGNCLETPAEPASSLFHLTVKQKAYPVQKFLGLYWAYLGPAPAPVIPPFDIWERRDGRHGVSVYPILDCNWLQSMENSVDPAHLQILHQDTASRGYTATSTTRGLIDLVERVEFEELPFGILKKRYFVDGNLDQHPLIFPNNLRARNSTQFRVPIDDTHTWHVHILFSPTEDGSVVDEGDDIPVQYYEPFKYPEGGEYPEATYTMHIALAQDQMAWEAAGPIADRTHERLATSDRGIVMYRELLKREIQKVQDGLDPMGVIRDPHHPVIDTGLGENLETAVYREIYRVADQDRGGVASGDRPTYQRYVTAPPARGSD